MRRQAQANRKKLGQVAILAALLLCTSTVAQAQVGPEAQKTPSTTQRRILISIPDRRLAVIEDGNLVKVYPIAVGKRGTPSPSGEFKIINLITNPTWYGHESGQPVPPGPENPLGSRWMGLSKKSYGIHGTNAPTSIGKRASHGCIRMAQADLEDLFEMMRVGDVVVLEAQRTTEVAAIFGAPQAPPVKPTSATAPVIVAAALPMGNL